MTPARWVSKYIKTYKSFLEEDYDYRPMNKNDHQMFKECNESMIIFAKNLNTVRKIEFTDFQLDVAEQLLPFHIPTIYNKFWKDYHQSILRVFGITAKDIEKHKILCKTARREGKTTHNVSTIVSLTMALRVEHGLDFKIAIPAQKLETSIMILGLIKKGLFDHVDFKSGLSNGWKIIKNTNEVLIIKKGIGTIEIRAFPDGEVSFYLYRDKVSFYFKFPLNFYNIIFHHFKIFFVS